MLTTQQQQKAIGSLLQKKENSLCADCNGKSPCWASLDFGVFVCMNCSGAHRALGPSITRVRSTKLDTWNRDWLQNMKIGNSVLNEFWQNQLVGVTRTSKPNINTSLNEIIKFVHDKYVKRKYVDQSQPLDPLKRFKLAQQNQIQYPPSKHIPPKAVKEVPKPQIKSNIESPFNAFCNLVSNKQKPQRKSSDNLINFEKEPVKTDLIGDNYVQNSQPTKYNHTQFHTVSGSKPKEEENLINFDSLIKNHEPQQQPHNNYLLNPHTNHFHNNQGHYSAGHFNNQVPQYHQNIPQFDKAQYVTMNINMNMYPKVMNINMGPQTTNNFLTGQSNQPSSNANFTNQFLGQTQPQKQPQNDVKISMDSNINLDSLSKQKKEVPKSWIDEWK